MTLQRRWRGWGGAVNLGLAERSPAFLRAVGIIGHNRSMERPATTMLRIGAWCVNPTSGQISRGAETARLETRTMGLLLCLAEHAGEVVSIDELLNQVWSGVIVTPDSVYQAVASLRRLLGDDPKQPTYIATVPRLGYRMVATVRPWADESIARTGDVAVTDVAPPGPRPRPRLRSGFTWAAGAAFCVALAVAFLFYGKAANNNRPASLAIAPPPQRSIAVLPFLDLTEKMNHEPFADGMTEELIDKLSKIPGLRVPAPTSSFYFKGKKIPIADIARTLGVAYVLDGSVRKSGARLRVAARLIRADNGYVVWSETYDRPVGDILMIQDGIAGEVTKALRASIEAGPNHDNSQ
jgi:transcriptional activator of cad operon